MLDACKFALAACVLCRLVGCSEKPEDAANELTGAGGGGGPAAPVAGTSGASDMVVNGSGGAGAPDAGPTAGAASDAGATKGGETSAGAAPDAAATGAEPGDTGVPADRVEGSAEYGWGPPETVVDDLVPFSLALAIDAHGNAALTWDGARNDVHSGVWGSVYGAASGTWQAPVELDPMNSIDVALPVVGMDDSGNAVALWQRQNVDLTQMEIWANRFDARSASWGDSIQVSRGFAGFTGLTVGATGRAAGVWSTVDGIRARLGGAVYDPEADRWDNPLFVDGTTSGNATRATVTGNRKGDVLAAWARGDIFNGAEPMVSRYSAAMGTWENGTVLGDHATIPLVTGAAINDDGSAVVAWPEGEGIGNVIRATYFDPTSNAWSDPVDIGVGEDGAVLPVQAAIDDEGNAIAVWRKQTAETQTAWSSRYAAATGQWSSARRLSADDDLGAGEPRIAMDGAGNAFVVWNDSGEIETSIFVVRYDIASDSWAEPQALDRGGVSASFDTEIAVARDGAAIVGWLGEGQGIYVNHYVPPDAAQ